MDLLYILGWINIGHLNCKLIITSAWFSLEFISVWHELYARRWMYYPRGPGDWRKEESFWTHQRGNKRGFWFLHYEQEFARCLSIRLGWQSDSQDNAKLPPPVFDHSTRVLTADGWTWWSFRLCKLCSLILQIFSPVLQNQEVVILCYLFRNLNGLFQLKPKLCLSVISTWHYLSKIRMNCAVPKILESPHLYSCFTVSLFSSCCFCVLLFFSLWSWIFISSAMFSLYSLS